MVNRAFKGLVVLSAVGAATLVVAAPASAASGDINCYGTKTPHLELNAKAAGTLRWVNNESASQTTLKLFIGGYSMNYGPYKQAGWTATNGGAGFYSTNGYCY